MPFDGIVTKCVSAEFNRVLSGGLIEKVSQPSKYELLLSIRNNRENHLVLLSANPSLPRAYITTEKKKNPKEAPMFCMFLRKHIQRGRIKSIESINYERIIVFNIESMSELGEYSYKKLIIEIMGKYSNIILVNENNQILESIKHVDFETSSKREIMPAREYQMPPEQDKKIIDNIDVSSFVMQKNETDEKTYRVLLDSIKGFSPYISKEICTYSNVDPYKKYSSLNSSEKADLIIGLNYVKRMITSNLFSPSLLISDENLSKYDDFHAISITSGNREYNKSISIILDKYYGNKAKQDYIRNKTSALLKCVKNNLKRLKKKEKIHNSNLKNSKKAPKYKLYGELVIANIHKIKKGQDYVIVQNYYENPPKDVKINLDTTLSPSENANRLFNRSRKLEKTEKYAKRELKNIETEKKYLEQLLHQIENVDEISEIDEIRSELTKGKYLKDKTKKKRKNNTLASKPYLFETEDNFDIYVGKNNRQNDYLTLKDSSSKDMWFHVKDYPGSHVILKYKGKSFTDNALEKAALLAAYHSKEKHSENVMVDYTTVKNVSRHPSKKPGLVNYINYKTIVVTPTNNLFKDLKRKE